MNSGAPQPRDAWKTDALSRVEARRTAVLVIDLQHDFCSDKGALAAMGSDVSPCRAVADRIVEFLPKIRDAVGLVAFFRLVYDIPSMSEAQRERLLRNGKPVICDPAGLGSELAVTPGSKDLVFIKHHYSAFSNDEFREVLRKREITTIAVSGVDTHICVEGTVRQGYDLGYRMLVLSDLIGTRASELDQHDSSLALCDRYFAITLNSNSFLQILGSHTAALAV